MKHYHALKPHQKVFVDAFVEDSLRPGPRAPSARRGRWTVAYHAANPDYTGSVENACKNAWEWAQAEGVKEAIEERQAEAIAEAGLDQVRIVQELARIGFFDPRRLFDAEGRLLPTHEWPDDVAAAVAGLDIEAIFDGRGDERRQVGELRKYRIWPKVEALRTLAQMGRMMPSQHEVTGANGGPILHKSANELTDDELAAIAAGGGAASAEPEKGED